MRRVSNEGKKVQAIFTFLQKLVAEHKGAKILSFQNFIILFEKEGFGSTGDSFIDAIKEFMENFGFRGLYEFDIMSPRFIEDCIFLIDFVVLDQTIIEETTHVGSPIDDENKLKKEFSDKVCRNNMFPLINIFSIGMDNRN